jgi:hypothetical protein
MDNSPTSSTMDCDTSISLGTGDLGCSNGYPSAFFTSSPLLLLLLMMNDDRSIDIGGLKKEEESLQKV